MPRPLLVAASGEGAVFSREGKVVGFLVSPPDTDEPPTFGKTGSYTGFILAAEEVYKATRQAQKTVGGS